MSKLKLVTISFVLILLCSCNSSSQSLGIEGEIYSKIIKKLSPMPPPPLKVMKSPKLLNQYMDSLSSKKVIVNVLEKTIVPDLISDPLGDDSKEYGTVLNRLISLKSKKIDVSKIPTPKNIRLNAVDQPKPLKFNRDITTWFVRFSEVLLDSDTGLGIVYSSVHLSDKSGKYRIHLLKYIDNQWIIDQTIVLEIS